ncbi:MmgE/PrpD family protein [Chloroflexota bacterium]
MNSTGQTTANEALSANVLDTRFEDFDDATIEHTKNRFIDLIGCVILGANEPDNLALVDLVKNWGGKEEATILVHGVKAPAQNVAMVNNIIARSFDFEMHDPFVEGKVLNGHTSATTVMTAVTMGEATGIGGKELITALLVGDNVACRIQAARSMEAPRSGLASGNAMFGATAIAGRLLGLNKLQMRNAFGITLNHVSPFGMQSTSDKTNCFKFQNGTAARNGIFSAELAKAGWTGAEDPFLGLNVEILTRNLGKNYYADANFKAYPCCRGTHMLVQCTLTLVAKHAIDPEEIEEVTIYAINPLPIPAGLEKPFGIGSFPHCRAIYSYQYTVANALLRKSVKPEHFVDEAISDPKVNALISKTKVEIRELPGKERGAEIKVRMKDGRELSEFNENERGDTLMDPLSKEEIIAKFRANVAFSQTVTKENAEKVLGLLEKLEELDNLNKLVKLLVV